MRCSSLISAHFAHIAGERFYRVPRDARDTRDVSFCILRESVILREVAGSCVPCVPKIIKSGLMVGVVVEDVEWISSWSATACVPLCTSVYLWPYRDIIKNIFSPRRDGKGTQRYTRYTHHRVHGSSPCFTPSDVNDVNDVNDVRFRYIRERRFSRVVAGNCVINVIYVMIGHRNLPGSVFPD